MLTALLGNIVLKWIVRRAMELGGIVFFLAQIIQALPPGSQQALQSLVTGHLDQVSIAALLGLGVSLWGYIWSFKSTTKAQLVAGGQQVPLRDLPTYTQEQMKDVIETQTGVRPEITQKKTK